MRRAWLMVLVLLAACGGVRPSAIGTAVSTNTAPPPAATIPASSPPPAVTAAPPAPTPARAPFAFVAVDGGHPGERATVQVKGPPYTSCDIGYVSPDGAAGAAQGLAATMTDANGSATWSWLIDPATRPGVGTVAVVCGPLSGVARILISP